MQSFDATLLEHMMEPKNYGELKEPSTVGIGKNPQNGEKVIIYLKRGCDEKGEFIADISFEAIGCTTTIVAGSMITQEARGLSFAGALNLVEATMKLLETLPPEDAACSEMVALALKAAIDTYEVRSTDPSYPPITYHVQNDCTPKEPGDETTL